VIITGGFGRDSFVRLDNDRHLGCFASVAVRIRSHGWILTGIGAVVTRQAMFRILVTKECRGAGTLTATKRPASTPKFWEQRRGQRNTRLNQRVG
jgi:hypothetical protein